MYAHPYPAVAAAAKEFETSHIVESPGVLVKAPQNIPYIVSGDIVPSNFNKINIIKKSISIVLIPIKKQNNTFLFMHLDNPQPDVMPITEMNNEVPNEVKNFMLCKNGSLSGRTIIP